MKAGTVLTFVGIVAIVGVGVWRSNLLRPHGSAELSRGENGMNVLTTVGKYGLYDITYTKAPAGPNGQLEVSSKGYSTFPIFGIIEERSTDFPDSGSVEIPYETPTRLYQNPDKTYELWVLMTRDATAFTRIQ